MDHLVPTEDRGNQKDTDPKSPYFNAALPGHW